jgi:hypothetical protein
MGSNSGGGAGNAAGGLPGAAHPYRKGVALSNSFTMFMSNDQYGALAKSIPY